MKKLNINPYIPMPVCLVGTRVEGKDNFMTVAWVAHVDNNPPMMAIGIGKNHYTCQGIEETGGFSVNVPGRGMMPAVDYAGLVSGKKISKAGLFETFRGETVDVPLVREAALCLECKLAQTVNLPSHNLYIAEIVGSWSDEQYLSDGVPDLKKMDPFFLSMPDNRYWGIGEAVGKAWDKQNRNYPETKENKTA